MDKLETMRVFAAVAQEGSFTAAAERLGISTKLASKYVRGLEASLDTQLFNRTTRSVTLTDVGNAYLEPCRHLIEQLEELEAMVAEKQTSLSGPIRITAPTGYGSTHLAHALSAFMAEHPKVEIDLKLSDNRVALVEEGFDLAVRIGPMRDSSLKARKLADMPLMVCAAPEYLAQNGRPTNPKAVATHRCLIDENQSDATFWRFISGKEEIAVKVNGAFRANSPAAIARMAMDGLGIARCPLYVIKDSLKNGQLEQLLPEYKTEVFDVHALYPLNRHLTARVRALIDHLAGYLK